MIIKTTPLAPFLLMAFLLFSSMALMADNYDEKMQQADLYRARVVKLFEELESRLKRVETGIEKAQNKLPSLSTLKQIQMEKHQITLRKKFDSALSEEQSACQLANTINSQNISKMKSSIGKAKQHINLISILIKDMKQVKKQQLSLIKTLRDTIPIDYYQRYVVQADASSLLRDAIENYERLLMYDNTLPQGLEGLNWFIKNNLLEIPNISSIKKKAETLVKEAKKRASFLDTVINSLKAERKRIDSGIALKKQAETCLVKIEAALKRAEATAAFTLANSAKTNMLKKPKGPWYVVCSNKRSVVLTSLPYSTSLGIGKFALKSEAVAFRDKSNRDGVCEQKQRTCPTTTVQIPDLLYHTRSAARDILNPKGLMLGTVKFELSSSTPAGKVILQYPYVGECVRTGTHINIIISSGASKPVAPATKVMTSMIIQPASIELDIGQVHYFSAVATYSDGSTDAVTHKAVWSGGTNTFTAMTPGTYTLTATHNDFTRTATIIVRSPKLVAISIVPASKMIQIGERIAFRIDANFDHSRFEDVTASAAWSGGGPVFIGVTPGQHDIFASYGGQMAHATITVQATSKSSNHLKTGNASSVGNSLATQMMNDPTRSGKQKDPALNDVGLDGFSPLPVSLDPKNNISDDDNWNGKDLDQEAYAKNSARRSRDDALKQVADQHDKDKEKAWDTASSNDQNNRYRQSTAAQKSLTQSQKQAQAANDAMLDALGRQQQSADAFAKRMDKLEQAAAALSKPAASTTPGGYGQSGSGGLSSVTVSQYNITISIWDHGSIDGDTIILKINGIAVTDKVTLKGPNEPFIYNANLPQQVNRIEIYAVNEGTSSPNTASVSMSHVTQGHANQRYRINQDEKANYGITVSF